MKSLKTIIFICLIILPGYFTSLYAEEAYDSPSYTSVNVQFISPDILRISSLVNADDPSNSMKWRIGSGSWHDFTSAQRQALEAGQTVEINIGILQYGEYVFTLHGCCWNEPGPTQCDEISRTFIHKDGYVVNHIKTQDIFSKVTNESQIPGLSDENISENIAFSDGFGRPIETIAIKASPLKKNIVAPVEYDEVGRQANSYLPYKSNSTDDSYRSNALNEQKSFYSSTPPAGVPSTNAAYAQTRFDKSPMSRAVEQGAPGETWQPQEIQFSWVNQLLHNSTKSYYGSPNVYYLSSSETWNVNTSSKETRSVSGTISFSTTYETEGGGGGGGAPDAPRPVPGPSPSMLMAPGTSFAYYWSGTLRYNYTDGYDQVPLSGISSSSHAFSFTVPAGKSLTSVVFTLTYARTTVSYAYTNHYDTHVNYTLNGSVKVDLPYTAHTIQTQILSNKLNEVIKWNENGTTNGYYAAGELYVTETIDENGISSFEYVDKAGRTVLKKAGSNHLTHYVYDKKGNLKFIIPPKANGSLNMNLVTEFEYDALNRLVRKKIPEATDLVTIYDKLGRAILTQDGELRVKNQWLFTKFDIYARPILMGKYTNTQYTTRTTMQNYVNNVVNNSTFKYYENRSADNYNSQHGYSNQAFPQLTDCEILSVTYYDDYDYNYDGSRDDNFQSDGEFPNNQEFTRLKGKVTKTKTRALGMETGEYRVYYSGYYDSCPATPNKLYYKGQSVTLKPGFSTHPGQEVSIGPNIDLPPAAVEQEWMSAVCFYDKYGRVIQTQSVNHLGDSEIGNTEYDFAGKVMKTKMVHNGPDSNFPTLTIRKNYVYDHAGRLIDIYQSNNGQTPVLVARNEYNELGQLTGKNLHSTNSGVSFVQYLDYEYNIRGWLTKMNNADLTEASDKFGMELYYDTNVSGLSIRPQYNGNISTMIWKERNDNAKRGYAYDYDNLNQLTYAKYRRHTSGTTWNSEVDHYTVDNLSYDLNGNITSLGRRGPEVGGGYIDNLTYTYINGGNKLKTVNDAVSDDPDRLYDFHDGSSAAVQYEYDSNGNMTHDYNKGISVKYNYLNLPYIIDFGGGKKIIWSYDAGGAKLRKTVFESNGQISDIKDYVGGFVYDNDNLEFFFMDEGRVTKSGASLEYAYDIKDHLGNVRVTVNQNGIINQADHYYPFGLKMAMIGKVATDVENKFTYNGKELVDNHKLYWYHYGARYYDPQLGRWHTIDPMDEYHSPYCYVGNNPVNLTDPDGMDTDPGDHWVDKMLTQSNLNALDGLSYELQDYALSAGGWEYESSAFSWSDGLDYVQTGLDFAGLIPGAGEIFDGINACIYTARGDYVNAGLSAAAMIPIAGWASTGGKIGKKLLVHGNSLLSPKITKLYRLVESSTGKILKYGITSSKYRYSVAWLKRMKIDMEILTEGSRLQMHTLEHRLIRATKHADPISLPLNKNLH